MGKNKKRVDNIKREKFNVLLKINQASNAHYLTFIFKHKTICEKKISHSHFVFQKKTLMQDKCIFCPVFFGYIILKSYSAKTVYKI